MSMNGLKQFISNVRTSKNLNDENVKINNELDIIFKQFKNYENNEDYYSLRKYVCELIYIYDYGFELTEFQEINAINEFNKLGTKVCLKLIGNEECENKEIGWLGIKKLYFQYLENKELEDIMHLVINDLKCGGDNETSNNNNLNIQSLNDLILLNPLIILDFNFDEFINLIIKLISKEDTNLDLKVKSIMFLKVLLNTNCKIESDGKLIKLFGNLIIQTNLNNCKVINSVCLLFKTWIKYDYEGIYSLNGIFLTKINEIFEIMESIQNEKNDNDEENDRDFDWLNKYGLMLVNLLELVNELGLRDDEKLLSIVNKIIVNCVNYQKFVFENKEKEKEANSSNKLINSNILLSSFKLCDDNDKLKIQSVFKFTKFNDDVNIRVVLIKEILKVVKNSSSNEIKDIILKEFSLWKRIIHERDMNLNLIICDILTHCTYPNLKFTRIREIVIILLYTLQNCTDLETKSYLLNEILGIFESFKDSGIIEEGSRKILKTFITVGNCIDDGWERIFKLFKYTGGDNLEIIEFIVKGLGVACCDNFVKLGALILKYNVENSCLGDLNLQLKILLEKYPTSSNLSKLLILDCTHQYYYKLSTEKLKVLVRDIFKQECANINVDIRQRSFEYLQIIELEVDSFNTGSFDLNKVDKLPEIKVTKLTDGWKEGYVRSIKFDQGILHRDAKTNTRITFRINRTEYKQGTTQVEIPFKVGDQEDVDCDVLGVGTGYKITGIERQAGMLAFQHTIHHLYPEEEEPLVQVGDVVLKLCLGLKTLVHTGPPMSRATFQERWAQLARADGRPDGVWEARVGRVGPVGPVGGGGRALGRLQLDVVGDGESGGEFGGLVRTTGGVVGVLGVLGGGRLQVLVSRGAAGAVGERVVRGL